MSDFITKDLGNMPRLHILDTYLVGHNGFIAGGCFKNLFNKEKIKDIDMFFESEADWAKAKIHFENDKNYRYYYENKKVYAFAHENGMKVELIRSVFGTPEQIINGFDFSIAKFAYYNSNELDDDGKSITVAKAVHHKDFFEHLFFKRLVIDAPLPFPIGTFERVLRYKGYGYSLCRESKANLIKAIKESSNSLDTISNALYEEGVD